jgi:hypothetical protein
MTNLGKVPERHFGAGSSKGVYPKSGSGGDVGYPGRSQLTVGVIANGQTCLD